MADPKQLTEPAMSGQYALILFLALTTSARADDEPDPEGSPPADKAAGTLATDPETEPVGVTGHVEGVSGGVVSAALPWADASEVPFVHWSEVRLKEHVPPEIPDAAKQLGIPDATCLARVHVDAKGRVAGIDLARCPKLFQDSVREAVQQWTFKPYRRSHRAAPFHTILTFRFVLK